MPDNKCCPTDKGPATCPYEPQGEEMYLTGPYNSKKGIVIIGDIFGMHHNSLRYADTLGKAGFLVAMPNFFLTQVWSADNWPPDFASEEWQKFWKYCTDFDRHLPLARKAVALLRQMGCTKIASIGMCWGSRLAFDLAGEKLIEAAATAHPSILAPEAVKSANTPVCIMHSKDEPAFEEVEAVVKASPFKSNVYVRYNALPHGFFGCRFDYDKCTDEERKEINDATEKSLGFFNEVLK
eukprot:gene126-75_t